MTLKTQKSLDLISKSKRSRYFGVGIIFLLSSASLGISGCEGLTSNSASISINPNTHGSSTTQSGTPMPSALTSPSPSSSPKPSPTISASPTATPTAPIPTTSPVAVSGVTPSWLVGKSLNTWIEIPNTSGAAGAFVDSWGELVLRDDTNELFILASGGHSDSSDNRVVSIRITDDAPQWVLRNAPTPADQLIQDAPFYADGKPSSRHNYQYNVWVPAVHRFFLFGQHGTWPNAHTYPTVTGFNPDTNTWDPAGTWPDLPSGAGYGVVVEKGTSAVWTNGFRRWDPISKAFSTPVAHGSGDMVRFPVSQDTTRKQLFSLQYGDSQGYSLSAGIQASRIPLGGDTQYKVTFNPSAALTQFNSDAPTYPAMDYDPVNDQFLFYYGHGSSAGKIYVIKPTSGNIWDMSILPLSEGSPLPPSVPDAGVNGRFKYIPSLKGFVLLPKGAANLWFIRTSN